MSKKCSERKRQQIKTKNGCIVVQAIKDGFIVDIESLEKLKNIDEICDVWTLLENIHDIVGDHLKFYEEGKFALAVKAIELKAFKFL